MPEETNSAVSAKAQGKNTVYRPCNQVGSDSIINASIDTDTVIDRRDDFASRLSFS